MPNANISQTEFQESFGKLLRTARQEAGLTYPELARRSGRGEGYLRRIERGERKASWRAIISIVRALPISCDLAQAVEHWYPQPSRQRFAQAPDLINRFPKLLREARDDAGLSVRDLARLAGTDPTYLSRMERGLVPPPLWPTMMAIVAQLPNSRLGRLADLAGSKKLEDSILELASDLAALLVSIPATTLSKKAWVSAVQARLNKCMRVLAPQDVTTENV